MQQHQTQAHRLAERAQNGDEAAFSTLVREARSSMYAAALAITRNEQDALDAVQEAILRSWDKLTSLRECQYVKTWMVRIAIRCASSIARKRRPNSPLIEEIPAPKSDLARRMDVRRAVDGLDEKTRICTVLYYLEDTSVAEIARMLAVSEGTVKSRLHRARAKLKEVLSGYDE